LGDHVLVGRCDLQLQVQIGEALEEDAQELDPGIRVQRGGPDALRRVPDVIGHPEAGLAGVVTGVERVDLMAAARLSFAVGVGVLMT
jgi:hypothetical protein